MYQLRILEPSCPYWGLSKWDALEPEEHLKQTKNKRRTLPLVASTGVCALKVNNSTDDVAGGGGDSLSDISKAGCQEEGEQDGESPKHADAALGLNMRRGLNCPS